MAKGRPLAALFPAMGLVGLCEENDDEGVPATKPSGEESRDDADDRSRKEAVEESRNLEGIFDWEVVEGE